MEESVGDTRAKAIERRRRMPPLRLLAKTCLASYNCTVLSKASILSAMSLSPTISIRFCLSLKNRYRCYWTVNVSNRMSCWLQVPISDWAAYRSCVMSS